MLEVPWDWRLNTDNDSRIHGQPSFLSQTKVLSYLSEIRELASDRSNNNLSDADGHFFVSLRFLFPFSGFFFLVLIFLHLLTVLFPGWFISYLFSNFQIISWLSSFGYTVKLEVISDLSFPNLGSLRRTLELENKDNLRHLPRFPDFFVTFRILSPQI